MWLISKFARASDLDKLCHLCKAPVDAGGSDVALRTVCGDKPCSTVRFVGSQDDGELAGLPKANPGATFPRGLVNASEDPWLLGDKADRSPDATASLCFRVFGPRRARGR